MNQVFRRNPFAGLASTLRSLKQYSNLSKEITKQNSLVVDDNTDLLIKNLKNTKSINGIFDLINTHYKIMNPRHTIQALRTIFDLKKQDNSSMSTSKILKHPDFEKICTQLKYQAGAIELNDTIEALKVMTYVGVPSDSVIYQILLQLIRHSINQLSLQNIIFLDFLLSKAKPTPLIEALQIALPIVYDTQLPVKLERTNVARLAEHLHYVSKKNVNQASVELIVNSLMKNKVFDADTSTSILWSLCDMDSNPFFEPLLNKALQSLEISGGNMSYHQLETTLTKLLTKYNSKTPFYYNEIFFDHCANVLIDEDLGFETAVHLLKKFLRVSHMRNDLLDYISEKCHQNPDLIEYGDPVHIFNVIHGCALTDFRPKFYETIKQSFLNIKDFSSFHRKDIHIVKLQMALSVLDIYIPEILEKCFSEDNLDRVLRTRYWSDFENLLIISQAIQTIRPEFGIYMPNKTFINKIKSKIKIPTDYPLKGSLHHVFGGETFVKTQIFTKMNHHIDHLILLRKDGVAAALNSTDMFVEDIQCDSPKQLVLIMVLNHLHYTINCQRLKAHSILMLKTLEAQGYTVVPICLEVWESLPDFEKIPYIMEAIKSRTEYYNRAYI